MRSGLLMVSPFAVVSMLVGCTQPMTPVDFHAPAGSTMAFGGKTFNLPAVVPLPRPTRVGDVNHSTVSFTFPGPENQSVSASGVLDVYGYKETDVDRLADNPCNITDAQIGKLLEGYAVELNGTAADHQPIYRVIIGKTK